MRLNSVGELGVLSAVVLRAPSSMRLFVLDDASLLLCCETPSSVVYIIRWCLKEGGYMEQVHYELLGSGIVIKLGDLRTETYIWTGSVSTLSRMLIINSRLFPCPCETVWQRY